MSLGILREIYRSSKFVFVIRVAYLGIPLHKGNFSLGDSGIAKNFFPRALGSSWIGDGGPRHGKQKNLVVQCQHAQCFVQFINTIFPLEGWLTMLLYNSAYQ